MPAQAIAEAIEEAQEVALEAADNTTALQEDTEPVEVVDENATQGDAEQATSQPAAFEKSLTLDQEQPTATTVSVKAPAGTFPEDATLMVETIATEQLQKMDKAVAKKRDEAYALAGTHAYRITVVAADGTQLAPADDLEAKVSFASAQVADPNLTTNVYRVFEREVADESAPQLADGTQSTKKTYTARKLRAKKDEENQSIAVNLADSTYYIVDYAYPNLQYVMQGDSVAVADILTAVGLEGEPQNVLVSNEELLDAFSEEDGWVVAVPEYFASEEWIQVAINGTEYRIALTDGREEPERVENEPEQNDSERQEAPEQQETPEQNAAEEPAEAEPAASEQNATDEPAAPEQNATDDTNDESPITVASTDAATALFGTLSDGKYTLRGRTYTLTEDVELSGYIDVPRSAKGAILDLNGHTLTGSGASRVIYNDAPFIIRDSAGEGKITGGKASDSGGAVYNANSLTVLGGTFEGNTAGEAGAIYNANGASLIIKDGTFQNNTATTYGGGAIVNSGTMTLEGGTFQNNTAKMNGGAIWNGGSGAQLNLQGGTVTGNTASNGGGIYCRQDGQVSMQDAPHITGNTPNSLILIGTSTIAITGRLADEASVEVSAETPNLPKVLTSGFASHGNSSANANVFASDNAHIWVGLDGDEIKAQALAEVAVDSWSELQTIISNATAPTNIKLENDITATSSQGRIQVNNKIIAIDLYGHKLDRNRTNSNASDTGGVIDVMGTSTLTVDDSQGGGRITGGNGKYGGGITVQANATLNLNGGTVTGNKATDGGGIYSYGTLKINGASVEGNTTTNSGGAIFVYSAAKDFSLNNARIANNTAGTYAGGIFINMTNKKATFTNAKIDNNTASGKGGAIYLYAGGVTMSGGTASNNASADGGSIFLASGTEFSATGTTFNANKVTVQSGGAITSSGTVNLNKCAVTNNEATANTAGGIYTLGNLTLTDTTVDSNKASTQGGGIYLAGGSATLTGGSVSGNTASDTGGIYVNTNAALTATGTAVSNNKSTTTGSGGIASKGTTSLNVCTMQKNTALGNGGAISATAGTLSLTGGTITGNSTSGLGGGIYADAELEVGGSPVITNNGRTNLYLAGNRIMSIATGFVPQSAQIGVSSDAYNRVITANLSASDEDAQAAFIPDYSEFAISTQDGEAYLGGAVDALVYTWNDLQAEINSASGQKVIGLGQSLDANGAERIKIKNKEIVLDLRGYNLNRGLASYDEDGQVVGVDSGGNLTLRDSSEQQSGKVTGGYAEDGGGVLVFSGGTLVIESGSIAHNKAKKHGGGVSVNKNSTLIMKGGSIEDNICSAVGGGISVVEGSVTITGGSVSNNTTDTVGGGIYSNTEKKATEVSNANINKNTANEKGGGIYVQDGITTVSDSAVCGNSSPDGGGVFVTEDTTFNATNTNIDNNKATRKSGGGIIADGTVNLTGGSVSGNTTIENGGGIYVDGATTTVEGTAFADNTSLEEGGAVDVHQGTLKFNGTATRNHADKRGGGIYVDNDKDSANIILGSNAVVRDNTALKNAKPDDSDVYLASGKKINVAGQLAAEAKVGVDMAATGTFTKNYKANNPDVDPGTHFFASVDGYVVAADSNGEGKIVVSSWANLQTLIDETPNGGTLTLDRKWTAGPDDHALTIAEGKTITIDLNGFALNRNLTKAANDGQVFQVSGTLTIRDSGLTGRIKGGNNSSIEDGGGAVLIKYGGAFNLEGGAISGNKAINGGAVYVSRNAAFTMSGGVIEDNTAHYGGGIYVYDYATATVAGGTFQENRATEDSLSETTSHGGAIYTMGILQIQGGSFTSNEADQRGGAVYINNGTTTISGGNFEQNDAKRGGAIYFSGHEFNLHGGTFVLNKASDLGGGIYTEPVDINVQGSPYVRNNRASSAHDIFVSKYHHINVTGALDAQAEFGVFAQETPVTFTQGFQDNNPEADVTDFFVASDYYYEVIEDERGEGFIRASWQGLQERINETEDGGTLVLDEDYQARDENTALTIAEGKTITINLNGHTLDRKLTSTALVVDENGSFTDTAKEHRDDGQVFLVNNAATLTILDSSETQKGAITGGYAKKGAGVLNHGTFNFQSGIITGNSADDGGGVYNDGTFTMSGGTISENVAAAMNASLTRGGGIYTSGIAQLTGGTLLNNASNDGAGVYIDHNGTLNLENATIRDNIATDRGGAIFAYSDAVLNITGGTIENNVACKNDQNPNSGLGGGIYSQGTTTIEGLEITKNTAEKWGGALYVNGGTATLSHDYSMTNNVALQGAGVYVGAATLNLYGGAITENTANSDGGGIYYSESATINVAGSPVVNNNSALKGRNVLIAKQKMLHVDGVLLDEARLDVAVEGMPRAVTQGLGSAGEGNESIALTVFSYNEGVGTAQLALRDHEVYVTVDANVFVSDWKAMQSAIKNARNGDVIALSGDVVANNSNSRLTVEDKTITIDLCGYKLDRNRGDSYDYDGQVLVVQDDAELTIRDSGGTGMITGGYGCKGGGIRVGDDGTVKLESGAIQANKAARGGGVYVTEDGTFTMSGGNIDGNAAVELKDSMDDSVDMYDSARGLHRQSGGGAYVEGTLTMSGGRITNNTASKNKGGGIDAYYSARLTMMGGTVAYNGALYGGGIFGDADERINVTGATVENNVADYGGGICLGYKSVDADVYMVVTGGTIAGNIAKYTGGGVYVHENSKFTATNTMLSGNTSQGYAGGMYVDEDATASLTGATVTKNEATKDGGGISSLATQMTVVDSTFTGNESVNGNGGGIYTNGGKLALNGSMFTENKAMLRGGGVYVGKNTKSTSIQNKVVVKDNTAGGDLFLGSGKKLSLSGTINPETYMKVALEDAWGVFTAGYSTSHASEDPTAYFGSSYDYEVIAKQGEVALGMKARSTNDFIDVDNQINPDALSMDTIKTNLNGSNWMSGISGERYLNEINIPYTHDAAMKEAIADWPTSPGAYLKFHSSARTQYRFINEQLEDGVRVFDLRLNNKVQDVDWGHYGGAMSLSLMAGNPFSMLTRGRDASLLFGVRTVAVLGLVKKLGLGEGMFEDDGENLWLCHGKNALAGVFWAGDGNDEDELSFARVLQWAEDFLTRHPTETIVLSFDAELTDYDKYSELVYNRARDHMKRLYAKTNPSTGKSYVYTEPGQSSPFAKYTHVPQLKDCRGQIVFKTGADSLPILGGMTYTSTKTVNNSNFYSPDGGNSIPAAQKIMYLYKFFDEHHHQLTTNAADHLNVLYMVSTNSKADSITDIIDPSMTPLAIVDKVHPEFLAPGKLMDQHGRYVGWFKMDGAMPSDDRYVWESNFFDGLEYCNVTAESGLEGDNANTKTYPLLRYTQITIPNCIYANPNSGGGRFRGWRAISASGVQDCQPGSTYLVQEDVRFVALWDNVDALHGHVLTKVAAQPASCETDGNIAYWVCDGGTDPCGKYFQDAGSTTEISLDDTKVLAYGHDWDGGVATTPATCEASGVRTYTCARDASHTQVEAIAPLGHNWGEWVVTKEATDTQEGVETRVCLREGCDKSETRILPKLDSEAEVYVVKQAANGTWAEPETKTTDAEASYVPEAIEHFTVTGYSTEFTTDENARTAAEPGATINLVRGAHTLYVYYARNAYDLVFYGDMAGTQVAKTIQVLYEAPLVAYKDEVLTLDDHTFAGWSTTPRVSGAYDYHETLPSDDQYCLYDFGDTMPDQTFSLYPAFVMHRLQVHLDLGSYDQVAIDEGYTWYDATKYGAAAYQNTPAYINELGSDGKPQARQFTVNLNEKIRMEAMNAATRDGYELVGWYTQGNVKWNGDWGMTPEYANKDAEGNVIIDVAEGKNYSYATSTLTASWKPKTIGVLFGRGEYGTVDPESATTALGSTITLPAAPAVTNSDYYFVGWKDKANVLHGAGEVFAFQDWSLTQDEELAFTAQYAQRGHHLVAFDSTGGSAVASVDAMEGTQVAKPADPTKVGHAFAGWYMGNDKVTFPYVVGTSDVTFTARWEANEYELSFDSVGGSEVASITATYGAAIQRPADPKKPHYAFVGWSPEFPNAMPAQPTTLRAIWTPVEYTMTFDANGGAFVGGGGETEQTQQVQDVYDASVVLPANPTRDGWFFDGWALGDSTEVVTVPAHMPDTNPVYKAQWHQHTAGDSVRETAVAATCEQGGSYYEVVYCSVCGTELSRESHTTDPLGHEWEETVTTAPTCEGTGMRTFVCTHDTSHKYTQSIPELGHDWGAWIEDEAATCTTAGHLHRVCNNNSSHVETNEIAPTGHDWGAWQVVDVATESKAGKERRVCAHDPSHVEEREVPKLNHQHTLTDVAAKAATCTEDGNVAYKVCSGGANPCGTRFSATDLTELTVEETVVPATGHDWKTPIYAWTDDLATVMAIRSCNNDPTHMEAEYVSTTSQVTKATTCTETGVTTYTASFSNEAFATQTKTKSIPATGHDWGEWTTTKAATCTEEGSRTRTCKRDATHVQTEKLAALGHDWTYKMQTTGDGTIVETRTCMRCGETKTTTYEQGHVHSSGNLVLVPSATATCEATGTREHYQCVECGRLFDDLNGSVELSVSDVTTPATGHVPAEPVRENEAVVTCTEAGSFDSVTYCAKCHKELLRVHGTVSATGHAWSDWTVTQAATCTGEGTKTRVCGKDSNHIEQRTISATGHDWGPWTVVKAATELAEGKEQRVCKRDGTHVETRTIPRKVHTHGLTKVEARAATCEESGNIAYWKCDTGENPCGKLFSNAAGTSEVAVEDIVVAAIGHDWSTATYVWSDDNAQVTATRVCENDPGHVQTETAPTASRVTKAATCTEMGVTTYTATFTREGFSTQTRTVAIPETGHVPGDPVRVGSAAATCTASGYEELVTKCTACDEELSRVHTAIPALGHDWGAWTVTRPVTGSAEGEEQRVCNRDQSHVETRAIPMSSHEHSTYLHHVAAKAATCDEPGNIEYWACDGDGGCGRLFSDAGADNEIDREETVVAAAHVPSDVPATENVVDATCTTAGSYDTVTSCVVCNRELSRVHSTTPALGHEWGEWTVTKPATETQKGIEQRICKRDNTHVETREIPCKDHEHRLAKVSPVATTCVQNGTKAHYQCVGCGKLFSYDDPTIQIQSADVVIPAYGHDWGEVTYVWSANNASIKATRTCGHDAAHVQTENVQVETSTTEATCTQAGMTTYTATFANEAFQTQTREALIPATGHTWDAGEVTTEPTCTSNGVSTFTCAACRETRTEAIPAKGHDYVWEEIKAVEPTCDTAGYTFRTHRCAICGESDEGETEWEFALGHDWGAWETTKVATKTESGEERRVCAHDPSHIEIHVLPTTNHTHKLEKVEAKAATCADSGNTVYWRCVEEENPCGKYFLDEDGKRPVDKDKVSIPAIGHSWDKATYTWASDNSSCTAQRTCSRDASHVEKETVTPTRKVVSEATATSEGKERLTAAFANKAFVTQTKDVVVPKLETPAQETPALTVKYRANIERKKWQKWRKNGKMAGTSGKSLKLQGIQVKLGKTAYKGTIKYRAHVQGKGWEKWKKSGKTAGLPSKGKRLEAIQIKLTGELAKHYDVYYRLHVEKFGWMGWAKNGQKAGSAGYSRRVEGIQITIVKKGAKKPGKKFKGIKQRTAKRYAQKKRR